MLIISKEVDCDWKLCWPRLLLEFGRIEQIALYRILKLCISVEGFIVSQWHCDFRMLRLFRLT